jgi:hypothetical protein
MGKVMDRRLEHFATRGDALALFGLLETDRPLWLALMGSYDSPESPFYRGAYAIPDLGITKRSNGTGDRYLVYDREVPIVRREVPRKRGGVRYIVDPWKNPPCLLFRCGGLYEYQCMIAGLTETSATESRVLRLFHQFEDALKTRFTHVRAKYWDCYVGPEAMKLLESGMRFTVSTGKSTELDLRWDSAKDTRAPK